MVISMFGLALHHSQRTHHSPACCHLQSSIIPQPEDTSLSSLLPPPVQHYTTARGHITLQPAAPSSPALYHSQRTHHSPACCPLQSSIIPQPEDTSLSSLLPPPVQHYITARGHITLQPAALSSPALYHSQRTHHSPACCPPPVQHYTTARGHITLQPAAPSSLALYHSQRTHHSPACCPPPVQHYTTARRYINLQPCWLWNC